VLLKRLTWLRLFWPWMRLAWHYVYDRDAWRTLPHDVPLSCFGSGCEREFHWYLDGESQVRVHCVDDVCAWLAGCEKQSDQDLFQVPDFWQHPRTFEQVRKGDCEDHALWAWRKLIELGYEVELMVGYWLPLGRDTESFHAWVVYGTGEERFLLESIRADASRMVRPLGEAHAEYVPHFSVDHHLLRRVYAGSVSSGRERREQREQREAERTRRQKASDGQSAPDSPAP
jgi:hypothetical protein